MKRICVFCGSKTGEAPEYREAARLLGEEFVRQGYGLVFGGGSVGLMGVIADTILERSGEVIGVIPERLAVKELLHPRVSDMRRVGTMHERKALMSELSDAFIAMPGGFGTFEEFFEVITWSQLGIQRKNIGLLNVNGFFDPLMRMIDHAIQEGFIREKYRSLLVVEERPDALLAALETHTLPELPRWLRREQT